MCLLNKNNIIYGINNLSTNSFTVLRDKTFLLMRAFSEGFVLINMETKKGEMILTKKSCSDCIISYDEHTIITCHAVMKEL